MDLAFDFLKGSISSLNADEANELAGLRLLDPKYIEQGRAGAPVAIEGDNSRFEEDASELGVPTVPGYDEGEVPAGTWLYPNIINPLAKPDFQMNPIDPAALIGSFRKPDWWRKQQEAPYGEGFKFHGIPDRDLRQIELPKGTQLGDINEAAQAIMENREPRTVYQRGRWGGERVPEIHDILSQMNLENIPVNRFPTFQPWEGKPVTSIPPQDPNDMFLAGEPMDLAWRLLKAKKEKPFHGYNPKKHSKKGGLNAKGRAAAKRKTGANLKPPVTTKPSKLKPGSKKAKRRKSFCARMTGVKGPTSKKGKLTPKGASLKRWNC